MDSWRHLRLLVFVFCLLKVSFPLQIDFNENFVGVMGENTTKLECAFIQEHVKETIVSLFLLAKNITSNEFIKIAQFRPGVGSLLQPDGKYLVDRVTLSNISTSSPTAILNFEQLICIDENEYECQVLFFNVQGNLDTETESSNLQVTVIPDVPTILPYNTTAMEGDNITISCFGDVGKPPGMYIWEKVMGGSVSNQYNVTTESNILSDSCSYHGTSNLTIQVTDKDDKAVIRCSVNDLAGGILYDVTQPLNVWYKVRQPSITRHPEPEQMDEYLQGSGIIKLNCTSRGNPQPSYNWYKDDNMNDTLSSNKTLHITEIITNNSGVYRCTASNNVSGIQYTESTTVVIRIVTILKTTTPVPTTSTTNKENTANSKKEDIDIRMVIGIVAGVAVFIIIIVIIGCVIIRRNRTNLKEEGVLRQHTVRNGEGYDSVLLDKGNDARDKQTESQSHNNLGYNPHDIEQSATYNMNKEDESPAPDNRHEYASVNEATKIKNRTIDRKPPKNQRNSNQGEDPYIESKDTYAQLGEKHRHKSDKDLEMYDKADIITKRL